MILISQPYSISLLLKLISHSIKAQFKTAGKQMKELVIDTKATLKDIEPLTPEMTWMQDF